MSSMNKEGNMVAAARAVIQAFPGHELLEKYGPLLRVGLDKAFERLADTPVQGAQFFATSTEMKGYRRYQAKTGVGLMRQSRDNEPLPKTEGGLGFDYEFSTLNYRQSISTERELLEKNLYGQFGKEQRDLADSAQRTLELIHADVFNRGFGGRTYSDDPFAGGNAQFICEDGAYLISKNRPNPIGTAGKWSNRLPDVTWTAGGDNDSVFAQIIRDARLHLRRYKNDRGDLSPKHLNRLIISPVLEDMAKRVTGTTQVYSGDATHAQLKFSETAINTVSGTPYTVYDWLSDGLIYMEGTGENELELMWRVRPGTVIYTDGNPDMLHQRIRMSLGHGCARPATWLGCMTTSTDNL